MLQGLKAFWEHLEVEHGITELLCPGCEKTGFPDKQTLRRHVKTYHGVKLPCEFCGKFFNEGNKMRRHVIEGKLSNTYVPFLMGWLAEIFRDTNISLVVEF